MLPNDWHWTTWNWAEWYTVLSIVVVIGLALVGVILSARHPGTTDDR